MEGDARARIVEKYKYIVTKLQNALHIETTHISNMQDCDCNNFTKHRKM